MAGGSVSGGFAFEMMAIASILFLNGPLGHSDASAFAAVAARAHTFTEDTCIDAEENLRRLAIGLTVKRLEFRLSEGFGKSWYCGIGTFPAQ